MDEQNSVWNPPDQKKDNKMIVLDEDKNGNPGSQNRSYFEVENEGMEADVVTFKSKLQGEIRKLNLFKDWHPNPSAELDVADICPNKSAMIHIDFPPNFNREMELDVEFTNPYEIEESLKALDFGVTSGFIPKLFLRNYDESKFYYKTLRIKQSYLWAQNTVQEGIAKAKAGDYKGAMELYDQALSLQPEHVDAHIAKGAAFANQLNYDKAIMYFERALQLDPNNSNARLYMEKCIEKKKTSCEALHTKLSTSNTSNASNISKSTDKEINEEKLIQLLKDEEKKRKKHKKKRDKKKPKKPKKHKSSQRAKKNRARIDNDEYSNSDSSNSSSSDRKRNINKSKKSNKRKSYDGSDSVETSEEDPRGRDSVSIERDSTTKRDKRDSSKDVSQAVEKQTV